MAIIHWSEEYAIHIEKIDNQHKGMIDYINSLYDAMLNKEKNNILENVLEKLTIYTVNHFKTEENLMIEYSYTDYETHKGEHQNFILQIKSFKEKYKKGESRITVELTIFLKNWLTNHIKASDKILGSYIEKKQFTK